MLHMLEMCNKRQWQTWMWTYRHRSWTDSWYRRDEECFYDSAASRTGWLGDLTLTTQQHKGIHQLITRPTTWPRGSWLEDGAQIYTRMEERLWMKPVQCTHSWFEISATRTVDNYLAINLPSIAVPIYIYATDTHPTDTLFDYCDKHRVCLLE